MATLTFAYDHSRDPMSPDDLSDKIATALGISTHPQVDINPTQIIVADANISAGNTAAIQSVISAYTRDATRDLYPPGITGTLLRKAKTALTANATYLAIGSPTNAQVVAQVQLLTREMDGVIQLLAKAMANIDIADLTGT